MTEKEKQVTETRAELPKPTVRVSYNQPLNSLNHDPLNSLPLQAFLHLSYVQLDVRLQLEILIVSTLNLTFDVLFKIRHLYQTR